jgi:hypothetical protein
MIPHESHLDNPFSGSSNSFFQGHPSRLHPFGLKFSVTFAILLLSILVIRRSQFDLYVRSFMSTGAACSVPNSKPSENVYL